MHAFHMPHSLNQPTRRLWMRHILNIRLLAFVMLSQSSFLHLLHNIPFSNSLNLSLNIVSDEVLLTIICHLTPLILESVPVWYDPGCLRNIILKTLHFPSCVKISVPSFADHDNKVNRQLVQITPSASSLYLSSCPQTPTGSTQKNKNSTPHINSEIPSTDPHSTQCSSASIYWRVSGRPRVQYFYSGTRESRRSSQLRIMKILPSGTASHPNVGMLLQVLLRYEEHWDEFDVVKFLLFNLDVN